MRRRRVQWSARLRRAIRDRHVRTVHYVASVHEQVEQRIVHECMRRVGDVVAPARVAESRVGGKRCVTFLDRYDKLIDSVTAAHLFDALGLQRPNRNKIVRTLLAVLHEVGPATVCRMDVASCFERIDRPTALEMLRANCRIGRVAERVLDRFDHVCRTNAVDGVPRGMAISSAVSEWLLSHLDCRLQHLPGVYFYARFVDDIVLVVSQGSPLTEPLEHVEGLLGELPGNLVLNGAKKAELTVSGRTRASCSKPWLSKSFEYLGYTISSPVGRDALSVDMSPRKVKRLKSKIVASFLQFRQSRDFHQLLDAMRYLSSNTVLLRRGNVSKVMHTGIFYNYPAITPDTYRAGALPEIDRFVRALVFGRKRRLSREVGRLLQPRRKKRLLRLSFVAGHRQRTFFRISRDKARRLVEGWKRSGDGLSGW
ncbi:antiviral reverse transcriptase Drt3a [Maioricimonas sp. JC845]|uniref:antiviral reverse transcriptase Drt3a n=1 Tax=Maioricimonas sp. JC845 TaxID=3232138 RepID=UPI003459C497